MYKYHISSFFSPDLNIFFEKGNEKHESEYAEQTRTGTSGCHELMIAETNIRVCVQSYLYYIGLEINYQSKYKMLCWDKW